jgi:hypothetical protein
MELLRGIAEGRHKAILAGWYGVRYHAEVLYIQYSRTWYRKGRKICAATANSTSLLLDCGLRTIVERAGDAENGNCSDGT